MPKSLSLIAITAIQRMKKKGSFATDKAPAVPPEIETIAPNTHFVAANAKEYEDLIAMGAARPNELELEPEPEPEKKTKTKKTKTKKSEPEPEPEPEDEGEDEGDPL